MLLVVDDLYVMNLVLVLLGSLDEGGEAPEVLRVDRGRLGCMRWMEDEDW